MALRPSILWLVLAGVSTTALYVYYRRRKYIIKKVECPPEVWEPICSVSQINLFPLKSGYRKELDEAFVTEVGLAECPKWDGKFELKDRSFVVYHAQENEMRTGRTYPKMILIEVSAHDKNHIALDAPTMRTLYVKVPENNKNNTRKIKFWRDERIEGTDCGEEAARWFSNYIYGKDEGLRLAYHDGTKRRDISKTHKELLDFYKNLGNNSTGLFHDLSALLLMSTPSVNELKSRMPSSEYSVQVQNFRPNIVVDGKNLKEFAEDNWDWIKIGEEVIARNVKDCTRCSFTTINADNGVRNANMEPLKTLGQYRPTPGPEKSPMMGINLEVLNSGKIKVGDKVYVGVTKKLI